MLNVQLYQYISSLIEKEDSYAMDVLFFCFRRTFEKNNFSFQGIHEINISEKFLFNPVCISLMQDYSSPQKCIALLLSLKVIILDPRLFDYCNPEELLFKSTCKRAFEWIRYGSILLEFQRNDDFYTLFCMLEDIEYDGEISEQLKEVFHSNTIVPPFKNLDNYYKKIASTYDGNTSQVIINNAYLGNSDLINLDVPKSVEYIGNTAFSFCKNLQTITLKRNDIKFGVFPIIECPKLEYILVPESSEEYYKEQLPFYKEIIYNENDLSVKDLLTNKNAEVLKTESDGDSSKSATDIVNRSQEKDTCDMQLGDIDTKKIEQVFKNKSTTYKFFWFLAILEIMKEHSILTIHYREILSKMIALSWPLVQNHISFGPLDSIHKIIKDLISELKFLLNKDSSEVEKIIYENYEDRQVQKILSTLTMNVPYRFLSPWIKYTSNSEVKSMSQNLDCKTPYALYDDFIVLDESWFDYFIQNYDELHSFGKSSLLKYLKSYNNELSLLGLMVESKE